MSSAGTSSSPTFPLKQRPRKHPSIHYHYPQPTAQHQKPRDQAQTNHNQEKRPHQYQFVPGTELHPYHLEIFHNGVAAVHMRVPYMRNCHFFIPAHSFTQSLRSLSIVCPVSLNGRNIPFTLSFRSPRHNCSSPAFGTESWFEILHANPGAFIELDTLQGPRAGKFLAISKHVRDLASIVISEGPEKIGVHTFDMSYPTPLSITTDPSCVNDILSLHVPNGHVAVIVHWNKEQMLEHTIDEQQQQQYEIKYSIPTTTVPAFDTIHNLEIPFEIKQRASDDAKRDSTTEISCFVNTRVQFSNPMPFDLKNVSVTLMYPSNSKNVKHGHRYDDELQNDYVRNQTTASPSESTSSQDSQSSSSTSSNIPPPSPNSRRSRNDQSQNESSHISSSSSEEFLDIPSNISASFATASLEGLHSPCPLSVRLPFPISLQLNSSISVDLPPKTVNLSVHYFVSRSHVKGSADLGIRLNNTSQEAILSGSFNVTYLNRSTLLYETGRIFPGEKLWLISLEHSPIHVSRESKNVLHPDIYSTSVVIYNGAFHIKRKLLDVTTWSLKHKSCDRNASVYLEIAAHTTINNIHVMKYSSYADAIREQDGENLNDQIEDLYNRGLISITVTLQPSEECVVVAKDHFMHDIQRQLKDCKVSNIRRLKAMKMISSRAINKLEKLSNLIDEGKLLQDKLNWFSERNQMLRERMNRISKFKSNMEYIANSTDGGIQKKKGEKTNATHYEDSDVLDLIDTVKSTEKSLQICKMHIQSTSEQIEICRKKQTDLLAELEYFDCNSTKIDIRAYSDEREASMIGHKPYNNVVYNYCLED